MMAIHFRLGIGSLNIVKRGLERWEKGAELRKKYVLMRGQPTNISDY